MPQLNQIVAIEKGVKSRVYGKVTDLHKRTQKDEPFSGLLKTYRKRDEDGEDFPPEKKGVKLVATDVLKEVSALQTELFDVVATKDYANCSAKADLVVDGDTILEGVPVTYLLFLEKQLTDMRTFIEKMPTLDPGEDWTKDPNSNLYKSDKTTTHKTKLVEKPQVVIPPTQEHPGQWTTLKDHVIVGWWDTVKHSGALTIPEQRQTLEGIDKMLKAVKFAREEANSTDVEPIEVGAKVFNRLFGHLL